MRYRVCKSFEVESGHMLSKHPGRCKYPHGHSRRIDIIVSSQTLDANDMVCDFKALKLAVADAIDAYDHAMAMNSTDPLLPTLQAQHARLVVYANEDPTTEVMARRIFELVASKVGTTFTSKDGIRYALPATLCVERVRVTETSTSWAEYGV
jgi:6-pyruvoyltetrahydropterin/6-carboxytetrahydropterin synthase